MGYLIFNDIYTSSKNLGCSGFAKLMFLSVKFVTLMSSTLPQLEKELYESQFLDSES